VSIHSPGFIAETDAQASNLMFPYYEKFVGRLGRERGWGPTSRAQFESEVEFGSQYVGSPETVAQKIAYAVKSVGAQRFDFKYANGAMPHEHMMRSIELYATKVIPRVRELLAQG
jgi:alkanesulfonate monooxygenase SsuD/methylene tetrahydromethanopterin reductase-like flavin-dependent oxidoreductase (luciferase family)